MTKTWIGIACVNICTFALFTTSSMSDSGHPVGANVKFQAVDTSALMLQPDRHSVFGVENAFPGLRFDRPVYLTSARDGTNRIFVVEQDGVIRVLPNDATTKKATVFLDLREKVRRDHNEEGMLGLAFHPRFRENGVFFVFHSITPRGSAVARFRVSKDDPNRADPASEQRILEYRRPYGNHNGGSLQFGPDGFLYISVGDGGLANDPHGNGQNLETLLATILRIDIDRTGKPYAIPKDNPFVALGQNVRGEIWAYGLRNPWRMSFDRKTGVLWAGDVGQDRFEEVNIIVRGGNYGWNLREGKHPRDPKNQRDSVKKFIDPIIEYPRSEGKSVVGGYVYHGSRLPELQGAYLYGDFLSGNIWALRHDGKKATANEKIAHTSLVISSFGEDDAGEIYFTALDGGIYRLRAPEKSERTGAFPRTLSDTGLFRSVKDHEPAPGTIPYDVNVKLWSDGAVKERFLALPRTASINFHETQKWEFPVGTVIVKTFFLPTDDTDAKKKRRLETRLWLQSPRGWEGYTYLWNDEETDAHLLDDWPFKKEFDIKTPTGYRKQEWYFPSRSDCQACHTHNVGYVLGWNTRQLNRIETFDGFKMNQIEHFKKLNLFSKPVTTKAEDLEAYPDWNDKNASLEKRARAYLDVNCALRHSPGGFGTAGGSKADLDFHNPFAKAFPQATKTPPAGKQWIIPGWPEHSQLIRRMQSRNGKDQMPPLATHYPDREALDVLARWIKNLREQ